MLSPLELLKNACTGFDTGYLSDKLHDCSLGVLRVFAAITLFSSTLFAQNILRINYIGADSHLYQFYLADSSWRVQDTTAIVDGAPVSSASPVASVNDSINNVIRIDYVGTDSHIHESFIAGGNWGTQDITAITGGTPVAPGGRIATIVDTINNAFRIDYAGADSHIHEAFIVNGTWGTQDITAITGATPVASGTAITSIVDSMNGAFRIDYAGIDSHIHEAFIVNGKWGTQDVTAITGATPVASDAAIASIVDTMNNAFRIDYAGVDSHIHELFIVNGGWGAQDLTAITGSTLIAAGSGISSVLDFNSNVFRLDYEGTDSHVHEIHIVNGAWGAQDLNQIGGSGVAQNKAVANIAPMLYTISGQVTDGGSGLNGVTITLTGTTAAGTAISQTGTSGTVNGTAGEYSFTVPGGGTYTVTPSLSGYTFSPGSSSFSNLSANQAANFNLTSTPGDSNPDPAPASYPNSISPPSAPPAGDPNITGTWTDPSGFNYQLLQQGSAVSGTVEVGDSLCGTPFQVTIQGEYSGAQAYSLTMTAPSYDACGYLIEPQQMTATMTLTSPTTATVTASSSGGGAGFLGSGSGSGGNGSSNTWTLVTPPLTFTISAPLQVPIPGATNNAQMLAMSTGDNPQVKTSASNSAYPIDAVYITALEGGNGAIGNPHSDCQASLSISEGTGTGSATSTISASPAGCSGVFGAYSAVGGTTTQNTIEVVVPPQILIQMLYGEAHGQAVTGDTVSEQAIGAAVRNRFGDPVYFSKVNTYQDAITGGQFVSIQTCQAAGNCVQNGTTPELSNAALLFGGVTTGAMNVANAKCFFSPDADDWSDIQDALGNSKVTVVPTVNDDPGCFSRQVKGQIHRENEQFVYKASIGDNANGSGAPAFIFVQYKKSSDPAVIQIP